MVVSTAELTCAGPENPSASNRSLIFWVSFESKYLETIDTHATASMDAASKYATRAKQSQPPRGWFPPKRQ